MGGKNTQSAVYYYHAKLNYSFGAADFGMTARPLGAAPWGYVQKNVFVVRLLLLCIVFFCMQVQVHFPAVVAAGHFNFGEEVFISWVAYI